MRAGASNNAPFAGGGHGVRLGTHADAEAMRREVLAEREKRRAQLARERAAASSVEDANDPAAAPVIHAVARLAQHPAGAAVAAPLLLRVLSNAANDPAEAKFRTLRLANKKVAAAVLDADGGLQLMEAVGFRLVEAPTDQQESDSDPRLLVLSEGFDPAPLRAAVRRLAPLAPAVAAQLAAPKRPPPVDPRNPPPGGRQPTVFLPAATCAAAAADLPDEYFERDAAEVQAELKRKAAAREAGSQLTTRAWKERQRRNERGEEGGAEEAAEATPVRVRVRMPDGCQLQGRFGRREKVAALREFVAGSLREPHRQFTLYFLNKVLDEKSGGDKKEGVGFKGEGYELVGTMEGAGLAPSALVTLKWTDDVTDGRVQTLTDALVAGAVPLE